MAQITPRQSKLLKAIIEEFIETARPVGSERIEQKYNLDISPATIRNEMAKLAQLGYLKKPHTSAGRVPTSMAIKYYTKTLMVPQKLSVAEEVGVKERIWEYRGDFERLLQEAVRELARRAQKLAIATTNQGRLWAYGMANLLDEPEFFDIDVTKGVLSLLDDLSFWLKLTERVFANELTEPFHLLVGEEFGEEFLEPCGLLYQGYQAGPYRGIIGVLGPARLPYPKLVPLVDFVAQLLSELG